MRALGYSHTAGRWQNQDEKLAGSKPRAQAGMCRRAGGQGCGLLGGWVEGLGFLLKLVVSHLWFPDDPQSPGLC